MSDFDDVLELLLTDPAFQARLAADPAAALAGYRLSADEVDLLRAQVTGDTGGQTQVEQRTSKASLFGLLSPLSGAGTAVSDLANGVTSGAGHGLGTGAGGAGLAPAGQAGAFDGVMEAPKVGDRMPSPFAGVMSAEDAGLVGGGSLDAPGAGGAAGVMSVEDAQLPSERASGSPFGGGGAVGRQVSDVDGGAFGGLGVSDAPVADYRTRVDVQGDGRWDEHTYVRRADGGIDIVVDADHDGRADFVGRDFDRDGLIDESYSDTDRDGVLDARYVDDNGDGWLDRRVAFGSEAGSGGVATTAAEGFGDVAAGVAEPTPVRPAEQAEEHIGRHRGPESRSGDF